MRRGQGSLEYLLILAAVLAIGVVVVLLANYMLGTPTEAAWVNQDKLNFAVNGFEIRGYDAPFDPSDNSTLPNSIVKDNTDYFFTDDRPDDAEFAGWLTDSSGNQHGVYTGGGDGDSGDYYVAPVGDPCFNGAKDGDETDIDCGGSCSACGTGQGCLVVEDCDSLNCTDNVCQEPTCDDLIMNQGESDVDCGGPCAGCADGLSCVLPGDCGSLNCTDNVCQSASCDDLIMNSNESDVDCGGTECTPCADGQACVLDSDCVSWNCIDLVCQASSCNDLVMNGDETDVDCGGSCAPCGTGLGCAVPEDCESVNCIDNVCQEPTCTDTILNGNETDVDCGGTECDSCVEGQACIVTEDCDDGFFCTGLDTCLDNVCVTDEVPCVPGCDGVTGYNFTGGCDEDNDLCVKVDVSLVLEDCDDGIDNNCDGLLDEQDGPLCGPGSLNDPGENCLDIITRWPGAPDSTYWIDPEQDGTAFQVYCDMVRDGGGWTLVWHGLPTQARMLKTYGEQVNIANDIVFNEMKVEGVNLDFSVSTTTQETAVLKKTIPIYLAELGKGFSSARVKFHGLDGVQDVSLTDNYFMYGYGNTWRVFYSCVNVGWDNGVGAYMDISGGFSPACTPRDSFVSSEAGCSGDYCQGATSLSPTESGLGLSRYEYQESKVWIR